MAQLMFVLLSQSLQNYSSDCGIFGSWHVGLTSCLLLAGGRVTRGTLHLSFACLLSPSPLLEPMTLVDEHENISMFCVLLRHPVDIWLSQDLKVFIVLGIYDLGE